MSRKTRVAITGLISAVALIAISVNVMAASTPDFAKYIGSSKKGTAKGTPVKIGFINQQGGKLGAIGAKAGIGAAAAVKFINKNGGIAGRPIQLVTCYVKNAEEEGQTCAQKFLSSKVTLVTTGGVAAGIQPFFKTLNGKLPVISGVATTPVDGVQKNAVVLFGDSTHVLGPMGTYAKQYLKAKTAAVIYPNTSGDSPGGEAIIAGLKKAGLTVKSATYDPGSADLSAPLAAVGASTADLVVPYGSAATCATQAKALKALGVTNPAKIVSAPLCLNGDVATALGGNFANWTYSIASSNYGDTTDKDMVEYMKVTKSLLKPGDAPDPWVIVNFGEMLTAAKILNQTGATASSAKIIKAARSFKGPQALGAPALACGKYSGAPSICNDRVQFFTYTGTSLAKISWKHAKNTKWLQPPS